jgi:hypothetical protein
MPDLRGMSMAEVRATLANRVGRARFLGSGRAAEQTPPPGADFDSRTEIIVAFRQEGASSPDAAPARDTAVASRSSRP